MIIYELCLLYKTGFIWGQTSTFPIFIFTVFSTISGTEEALNKYLDLIVLTELIN